MLKMILLSFTVSIVPIFLIKADIIYTYLYAAKLSRAWYKLIPFEIGFEYNVIAFQFLKFLQPEHLSFWTTLTHTPTQFLKLEN